MTTLEEWYDHYYSKVAAERSLSEDEWGLDPAVNPFYYKLGDVETIDFITSRGLSFCLGNVVKYVGRAGLKAEDELGDLKKALWYLKMELYQRGEGEDPRDED